MELTNHDYTVGWICAIPIEAAAALAILDEEHGQLSTASTDTNNYSFGRVGKHNVVIACLPSGRMGTVSAATVAIRMLSSFPALRFGLMVGIGGGAPKSSDIRLGDIVVSQPTNTSGGVIQYDFGKTIENGRFIRTGSLNGPPPILLNALSALKAVNPADLGNKISDTVRGVRDRDDRFYYPEQDRLFRADYDHIASEGCLDDPCAECCPSQEVKRPVRKNDHPYIHYGLIASGNQVIKNGITRDKISDETGIVCFEMEAAGLMNDFPCLVIRGICDYSDTHKNKQWQPYAALVAAAYARELLHKIPPLLPDLSGTSKRRTRSMASENIGMPLNTKRGCFGDGGESSYYDTHSYASLKELRVTDPRHDKKRIENTKGGLFRDSYHWILENSHFRTWRDDNGCQLLWINGDPGKGKTMLLCGIINEFDGRGLNNPAMMLTGCYLSYFFCQATDPRINSAIAVLRGLIYLLVIQEQVLLSHLEQEYSRAGKQLFEDRNAWVALSELFLDILRNPIFNASNPAYLIVDALDECVSGLEQFCKLIVDSISASPHVKWVVSSRNWPGIEDQLARAQGTRLSLEINARVVSHAVEAYINHRVSELSLAGHDEELQNQICKYILGKADGTFLWAALVLEELLKLQNSNAEYDHSDVFEILQEMPNNLAGLYDRMIKQINSLPRKDPELCRSILSVVTLAHRPLHLREIPTLAGLKNYLTPLERLISKCGSFLTIRENIVYFVHQSAKDYLIGTVRPGLTVEPAIFHEGVKQVHHSIFLRSLQAMFKTLKRNIYALPGPETRIDDFSIPDPDPLATVRYSCIYWVRHLREGNTSNNLDESDCNEILGFLRQRILNWLEALSLIRALPDSIGMVEIVRSLAEVSGTKTFYSSKAIDGCQKHSNHDLHVLSYDAKRFILMHRSIIEERPLQLYSSCLLFSPERSVVRSQHWDEIPSRIKCISAIQENWDLCLATIEGRSKVTTKVFFSPDGKLLAVGFNDRTIKLWDSATGASWATLKGHTAYITSILFSPDGKLLASSDGDCNIKLWDITTGVSQATFGGYGVTFRCECKSFSSDGLLLVSSQFRYGEPVAGTIVIWDTITGTSRATLEVEHNRAYSVSFSPSGKMLIPYADNNIINLWDATTGDSRVTFRDYTGSVVRISLSPNGSLLAAGLDDGSLKLWDTATGISQTTIEGHSEGVWFVLFSPDSKVLLIFCGDETINLWDIATEALQTTFTNYSDSACKPLFSPDSKLLVFPSDKCTLKLWDSVRGIVRATLESSARRNRSILFSPDGRLLAFTSKNDTIGLWDTTTGTTQAILDPLDSVNAISFSPDGKLLASGTGNSTIKLWDTTTRASHITSKDQRCLIGPISFSPDGKFLASGFDRYFLLHLYRLRAIRIWDIMSRTSQTALDNSHAFDILQHPSVSASDSILVYTGPTAFSPDSKLLASGFEDGTIKLWDTTTGTSQELLVHLDALSDPPDSDASDWDPLSWHISDLGALDRDVAITCVSFSPDGKVLASGSRNGAAIRLWDVPAGTSRAILSDQSGRVCSILFSPDGQLLASGSNRGTVRFWNIATRISWITSGNYAGWVEFILFSPDGKLLVFSCTMRMLPNSKSKYSTTRLWDIATGTPRAVFKNCRSNADSISFSSDSKLLAVGYHGGTIELLDTTTGTVLTSLSSHTSDIIFISFSPDSNLLASGSRDVPLHHLLRVAGKLGELWALSRFLQVFQ
ncbi:hypothetical protein TWF281_003675 [Arthrobotrys megalospora]